MELQQRLLIQQKQYFENDLTPTDITNVGKIDITNIEILRTKSGDIIEK